MARNYILIALLGFLSSIALAGETDISTCPRSKKEPESLGVFPDQVLVVRLKNGASAAIHLTSHSFAEASYRWMFQRYANAKATTGEGRVREDFDRINLPGRNSVMLAKKDAHNPYIVAGDIKILWSPMNSKSGWIYYCRDSADAQLVPAANFDWAR